MEKPEQNTKVKQIQVSDREAQRMRTHIYQDFEAARSNHDRRIEKFRRIYRMWRGLSSQGNKEDGAAFQLPMLKWFTFGHWARCMQSLLGDDAQIIGVPTAPTDDKDAQAAGDYMTWRFFEYMQSTNPLTVWIFRSILFGVGHAEMLYEQDYYWERDLKTGKDVEKLAYDGPIIRPLWPSQMILPAQDDIRCMDDFEWQIRRRRVTPQQLLDGERRGRYQHVKDHWDNIIAFSQSRQERDYWWDDERLDADWAEGIDHATVMGNRDSLEMWEWYGKWRLPKGGRDAKADNLDYRQDQPSELLIKYLPHCQHIVGIQDRRDMFPRMKKRTPFLDIHLVKDGSYWGPGLGEMLEDIQREGTINHNLFRRAGMFSVGPVVFYRPGSGFDPETFEYKPNTAIPTEDPAAVNVVNFKSDLQFPVQMGSVLKGIAELVTGVSDTTNGQSIDRPNAPRTASGQAMLIQEGNVRASLDMTMLREDTSAALSYLWALDRELADEEVFFRVTEQDAVGYDVDKGFGRMTSEQREHEFGFELKFATSIWSREAKKQAVMALYQVSVTNPLVAQNPRALWSLLNRVWEAFGEKNFKDVLPEPPEMDEPKAPRVEWALALAGKAEDVQVNPSDDDQMHVTDHRRRLDIEMQEPEERRDKQAEAIMVHHIIEHEAQIRQKRLMQAMAEQITQQMQAQQQPNGLGQPQPQPPGFVGPPPQPFPGAAAAPNGAPGG